MKKTKRKTKSPRSPGAVDKHIGARMRESRLAINMSQSHPRREIGRHISAGAEVRKRSEPRKRALLVRDLRSFWTFLSRQCLSATEVRLAARRLSRLR